eukprot:CAMPEP_0195611492 /NCGR_PEP_ID=MMETSP0815-20121206/10367_1 /TAXON_ID=97485 /ORGANISM="Prymnesium parvum, Strain Texoma1" /LENGTH=91 /DNA_ID=CAMNT_0040751543 /DNA_START=245 /DNA_END=520 /DNA_ORIENTATION=-
MQGRRSPAFVQQHAAAQHHPLAELRRCAPSSALPGQEACPLCPPQGIHKQLPVGKLLDAQTLQVRHEGEAAVAALARLELLQLLSLEGVVV